MTFSPVNYGQSKSVLLCAKTMSSKKQQTVPGEFSILEADEVE